VSYRWQTFFTLSSSDAAVGECLGDRPPSESADPANSSVSVTLLFTGCCTLVTKDFAFSLLVILTTSLDKTPAPVTLMSSVLFLLLAAAHEELEEVLFVEFDFS